MDTKSAPTKKDLLERLLDAGMVMVHLDARQDGVDVPVQFREDSDLRLNLSYRFQFRDLRVEPDTFRATLSFGGQPYTCEVPLPAVYAMVSHVTGEGFFFPEDAPPEALAALAAMVKRGELQAEPEPLGTEPARSRPLLRAIDGGPGGESDAPPDVDGPSASDDTEARDDADAERDDGEVPRRPSWLRVVK